MYNEVIDVCRVLLLLYHQYDILIMMRFHGYWLHVEYFSCQMFII